MVEGAQCLLSQAGVIRGEEQVARSLVDGGLCFAGDLGGDVSDGTGEDEPLDFGTPTLGSAP